MPVFYLSCGVLGTKLTIGWKEQESNWLDCNQNIETKLIVTLKWLNRWRNGMNPNFPRIKILGWRSVKLRSISRMKDQSRFGEKNSRTTMNESLKWHSIKFDLHPFNKLGITLWGSISVPNIRTQNNFSYFSVFDNIRKNKSKKNYL